VGDRAAERLHLDVATVLVGRARRVDDHRGTRVGFQGADGAGLAGAADAKAGVRAGLNENGVARVDRIDGMLKGLPGGGFGTGAAIGANCSHVEGAEEFTRFELFDDETAVQLSPHGFCSLTGPVAGYRRAARVANPFGTAWL